MIIPTPRWLKTWTTLVQRLSPSSVRKNETPRKQIATSPSARGNRGCHPGIAQVHRRDPRHTCLLRRDPELIRRGRCSRAGETCGLPFDPVNAEPPRERMRKDVREFIRRLEAAGLTVEPTPGHYRVLRDGKPLRRANGMPFTLPFSPDTIRWRRAAI